MEDSGPWAVESVVRVYRQVCRHIHNGTAFFELGRQLFDTDPRIIEVDVAFNRMDKLRTRQLSEVEGRLILILPGHRRSELVLPRKDFAL